MQSHIKITLAILGVTAVAACDASNPGTIGWNSEAGSFVDNGTFGNANMNNTLVQSGDRQFVLDLSNRFAEEVPSTVNFAFNSAQLDEQARSTLQRQADWIRQFPEVRFRVFGHTDAVGSDAYNQRLGLRRANAAVNYLVSQGISRSRLEAVASFGETQPLIVTQGRERRNRRTVTEVSGFVQSHPTVLNGKYAQVIFREYVDPGARPESQLTGIQGSEVATEE